MTPHQVFEPNRRAGATKAPFFWGKSARSSPCETVGERCAPTVNASAQANRESGRIERVLEDVASFGSLPEAIRRVFRYQLT